LSRSFEVEPFEEDQPDGSEETEQNDMSIDSKPEDDAPGTGETSTTSLDLLEVVEEDEENEANHVGMVPFADILNAKSGCNNARLFYEKDVLNMTATQTIKKGEQIFNTYAEPPNSDLLRRYGHVDEPNDHDVVELSADLVADVVCTLVQGVESMKAQKVDWALEQGIDDVFSLSRTDLVPDELLSYILLFASSKADFDQIVLQDEIPKPQRDALTMKVLKKILEQRLAQYPTSTEDDIELLKQSLSYNHRNALIVRMGEKQLILQAMEECKGLIKASKSTKKRGSKSEDGAAQKRSKKS